MKRRMTIVPFAAVFVTSTLLAAPAQVGSGPIGIPPRSSAQFGSSPSSVWGSALLEALARDPMTNPRNSRAIAALHVAVRDAIAAARAAGPADPARERGAAAGAASALLPVLVPSGTERWQATAEAERARVELADRARFDRGHQLGARVGREILARVESDGAEEEVAAAVPSEPGHWSGSNPIEPGAARWRPWLIASPAAFRPAPPPAYDSPQRRAELDEVRSAERTPERIGKALYWQTFEGVFTEWYRHLDRALVARGLESDALFSARAYAAAAMAHHDAMLAAWDGKYAYWTIRPAQLDAALTTLFPTPNHPSYPAAHAVVSTAIAEAISAYFPEIGDELAARAREAGESRLWAGVHFRSDLDAGAWLGRDVARAVIAAAPPPSSAPRAAGGR